MSVCVCAGARVCVRKKEATRAMFVKPVAHFLLTGGTMMMIVILVVAVMMTR